MHSIVSGQWFERNRLGGLRKPIAIWRHRHWRNHEGKNEKFQTLCITFAETVPFSSNCLSIFVAQITISKPTFECIQMSTAPKPKKIQNLYSLWRYLDGLRRMWIWFFWEISGVVTKLKKFLKIGIPSMKSMFESILFGGIYSKSRMLLASRSIQILRKSSKQLFLFCRIRLALQ